MKQIITCLYESPCGMLMLGALDGQLCLCDWQSSPRRQRVADRMRRLLRAEFMPGESEVLEAAMDQLDEYFEGSRRGFDIPLLFAGTDFQQRVWRELLTIPYGFTLTYAELARRVGRPKTVRGVANAVALNALSIFAPCHRIVGSDGSLTGYAGGLDAKFYLLHDIENAD